MKRGWARLYAVTPDHHPVIEEVLPGFAVAAGFSGHGFQHAPAADRVVAHSGRPVRVEQRPLDGFLADGGREGLEPRALAPVGRVRDQSRDDELRRRPTHGPELRLVVDVQREVVAQPACGDPVDPRPVGQRFEVVGEVGHVDADRARVDREPNQPVEEVGGASRLGDRLELVDEHQRSRALGERGHDRFERRFEHPRVEARVPTVEDDRVDVTHFRRRRWDGQSHVREHHHLTQGFEQRGLAAAVRSGQHRHVLVRNLGRTAVVADRVRDGLDGIAHRRHQRQVTCVLHRDTARLHERGSGEVVGVDEAGERDPEGGLVHRGGGRLDRRPTAFEPALQFAPYLLFAGLDLRSDAREEVPEPLRDEIRRVGRFGGGRLPDPRRRDRRLVGDVADERLAEGLARPDPLGLDRLDDVDAT
ncbi:FAD dependent oxidoreductase [Halococcus hamelinensis 100A6]|uniref:FAD dependent oxidoreductase n=1 Tax=Halococcus hamelinensis 100A6 TaxID=1132509 RepID=M0LZQ8_9EURY|nr:FAD dependent oxidoreductase [Halococcus hamelinensis 100A6]